MHARGGVISWNHPFGDDSPPLLAPAARDAKRRQVFADLLAVDLFGMDVIEVGYNTRGGVDAATHLALWDTLSRAGRFLTGNGTSDDHSGKGWKSLNNGYATGLWATSAGDAAIATALSTGRAFAGHAGRWPGGEIDMLVDGTVPMGGVSVGGAGTRQLAIAATALPAGSSVQVVSGPVDYAGAVDPGDQRGGHAVRVGVHRRAGDGAGERDRLAVLPGAGGQLGRRPARLGQSGLAAARAAAGPGPARPPALTLAPASAMMGPWSLPTSDRTGSPARRTARCTSAGCCTRCSTPGWSRTSAWSGTECR